MRVSESYFLLARINLSRARVQRIRGHSGNVRALVRAARGDLRTARTWQHLLESAPADLEEYLAMCRRIQPFSK